MQQYDCELVHLPDSDELKFLPEGPYALGNGLVSWVAIQHGANSENGSINILDLGSGSNQQFDLTGRPGFAFPTTQDGQFVVGQERQLTVVDTQKGTSEPLTDVPIETGVENTIINDGEFFDEGFVFGCKDLEFQAEKAGLYSWRSSDRTLHQLANNQICSNGKVITGKDGVYRILDIDSPTKKVVEYTLDVAAAKLEFQRVVVDCTQGTVFPDGMIATPDGESVVIAFYNPNHAEYGEARQYSIASGELETVWRVPQSPQVTCPQWVVGGEGQIQLFLTTAVEHMNAERRATSPNAGALFVGPTDWHGEIGATRRFAL